MTRKTKPAPTLTKEIIYAAMLDAGNRSMRTAGRTAWNEKDRNAACDEFDRLAAQAPELFIL